VVVLPFSILAAMGIASAQVAANLSASAGSADFSASGMSASLSASNSAGSSGVSGVGNGLRAQSASTSSVRLSSVTSRALYRVRGNEMMQDTIIPPLQSRPRAGLQGLARVHPSMTTIGPIGLSRSSQLTAPAPYSSGRSSSSLQTPVYSFLVGNESIGSRPSTQRQSRPSSGMHSRGGKGALIRSLSGMGSSSSFIH
jgi:hypothetical protein